MDDEQFLSESPSSHVGWATSEAKRAWGSKKLQMPFTTGYGTEQESMNKINFGTKQ